MLNKTLTLLTMVWKQPWKNQGPLHSKMNYERNKRHFAHTQSVFSLPSVYVCCCVGHLFFWGMNSSIHLLEYLICSSMWTFKWFFHFIESQISHWHFQSIETQNYFNMALFYIHKTSIALWCDCVPFLVSLSLAFSNVKIIPKNLIWIRIKATTQSLKNIM